MAEQFSPEQIQQVIENGIAQAQELMNEGQGAAGRRR